MFPVHESFRRYPIYNTPCPLEGCQEVFKLPHDDTLATLHTAADITARQCEMHLLYHKVHSQISKTQPVLSIFIHFVIGLNFLFAGTGASW